MKYIIIIMCVLALPTGSLSQDGGNMRYVSPAELDSTIIGQPCVIDFGEISFGGISVDTLEIDVNGQLINFYEHRADNGFNNWFNEQYLVSTSNTDQGLMHLSNSRIDSLTANHLFVTSVISYHANDMPLDTITIIQHEYELKNVAKVLFLD